MIYIFTEDDTSAIILNTTSGVSDVIVTHSNATYKGSAISTSGDCCGVLTIPKDIISGIRDTMNNFYKGIEDLIGNAKPVSQMLYVGIKFALDKILIITSKQFLVFLEYTLGSKNILFSKRRIGNMHLSKINLPI